MPGIPKAPVGGYKVIYRYANDLAKLGVDVALFHCDESQFCYSGRSVPPLTPRDRARRAFRGIQSSPQKLTWFDLHPRVVVSSSSSLSENDVGEADAVVATSCWTAPFVAALASSAGRKYYFIQHFEDWSGSAEFVESTWRLPLTKIVIAKWLISKADELGESVEYLPNAIDLNEFPLGPQISDRKLAVSAMLSDISWKRADLVIDVLAGLKAELPDVEARTFGTGKRPEGLPRWVQYLRSPEKSQISREVYQYARVYICASDAEGWHLPPAEALASGSAVVSTDIEGVREYADEIGAFSPVGDSEALLRNTINLLADPSASQSSVSKFRHTALAYTPSDAADRLLAILE